MEGKDTYFVAVKIFLLDPKGNFLITKDRFGDWDIPGGRLRANDFNASLESVAERKIREELGGNVHYKLGGPILFMRHERDEFLPTGEALPILSEKLKKRLPKCLEALKNDTVFYLENGE